MDSGCLDEFRAMVKALHAAGIEVVLDVVYNHTSEVGAAGPTYCYRGIDNSTYYLLGIRTAAIATMPAPATCCGPRIPRCGS